MSTPEDPGGAAGTPEETPEGIAEPVVGGPLSDQSRLWARIWEDIERLEERLITDSFHVEAGSSLADDDAATAPNQLSHGIARLQGVAADHLVAVRGILQTARIKPIYALSTLARSALEAAALGLWVLGPVETDTRVCRHLCMQAKDAADGRRARQSVVDLRAARENASANKTEGTEPDTVNAGDRGYDTTDPKQFFERHQGHIERIRDERQIDASRIRPHVLTEVMKSVGSTSGLPSLLLTWQLCSGHAHGRQWAFTSGLTLTEVHRNADQVVTVRASSSDGSILGAVGTATLLSARLIDLFDARSRCPH